MGNWAVHINTETEAIDADRDAIPGASTFQG
jgi:hypothetical protein